MAGRKRNPPGANRVNVGLRIDPDVRELMVASAQAEGIQVFAWLTRAIRESADKHAPQQADLTK